MHQCRQCVGRGGHTFGCDQPVEAADHTRMALEIRLGMTGIWGVGRQKRDPTAGRQHRLGSGRIHPQPEPPDDVVDRVDDEALGAASEHDIDERGPFERYVDQLAGHAVEPGNCRRLRAEQRPRRFREPLVAVDDLLEQQAAFAAGFELGPPARQVMPGGLDQRGTLTKHRVAPLQLVHRVAKSLLERCNGPVAAGRGFDKTSEGFVGGCHRGAATIGESAGFVGPHRGSLGLRFDAAQEPFKVGHAR